MSRTQTRTKAKSRRFIHHDDPHKLDCELRQAVLQNCGWPWHMWQVNVPALRRIGGGLTDPQIRDGLRRLEKAFRDSLWDKGMSRQKPIRDFGWQLDDPNAPSPEAQGFLARLWAMSTAEREAFLRHSRADGRPAIQIPGRNTISYGPAGKEYRPESSTVNHLGRFDLREVEWPVRLTEPQAEKLNARIAHTKTRGGAQWEEWKAWGRWNTKDKLIRLREDIEHLNAISGVTTNHEPYERQFVPLEALCFHLRAGGDGRAAAVDRDATRGGLRDPRSRAGHGRPGGEVNPLYIPGLFIGQGNPEEALQQWSDALYLRRIADMWVCLNDGNGDDPVTRLILDPSPQRKLEAELFMIQRISKEDSGRRVHLRDPLTVTEAARLLIKDFSKLTLNGAKSEISRACGTEIKTNGKKRLSRRIEADSFDAWRLRKRDASLDAEG